VAAVREPHTITKLLHRMEKVGLVTKTNDLEKKNMVGVSITEKGQQAYEQ
jgi:DNA-binding MarR family transcriptional regulator